MKGPAPDFGGVISVTLFERHARSEQALGLPPGTLTWRGCVTRPAESFAEAQRAL
jgi:putative hydrolase of the HAD superfamily